MKRTHLLANVAFDKATADVNGVYDGFLDAAQVERVLMTAKKAGYRLVRVMIDNEIIHGVDALDTTKIELVMLHFVVGVDVPVSVVVAAVGAWKNRVSDAFFEIDLA